MESQDFSDGPGAPPLERTPPNNIEAEQALLGAILANNRNYERVSEFLHPEHFADPVHGRIFEAVGRLVDRQQIANPVTLKGLFDQDEVLAEKGGAQYLVRLVGAVVTTINVVDYGRLVHDLHLRRQLIDIGETVVNSAFTIDMEMSARDQLAEAEQKLFNLAEVGDAEGGLQGFDRALTNAINQAAAAHKREGKLAGVPTGLTDLDRLLGGLHRSDLLILAGRPSMGKTALATNIGFNAATRALIDEDADRYPMAFFSLEMSAEQLATRILAEQTRVASERIRRGELKTEEFDQLIMAAHRLEAAPIFIDDTPAITPAILRTRARRLKRQHGLGLIIVDYLQLMQGSSRTRSESRVLEVSEITRSLKAVAKELDVPVLALSQLSRAVEQREDKRPQLADLRESGSIEQDADVVMFVFREQYYLERAEPSRRPEEAQERFDQRYDDWRQRLEMVTGLAEVIIAKQRHGPVGKVTLTFEGETTRFGNFIADDHVPPGV